MKLSNLFNDCVRVAQGLRKGSARSAREWLKQFAVLAILLFVVSGELWGTNFNTTYNYAGQGTSWSITNASDESSYYKSSNSSDCVVTVPGIFTGKTITSNVVITLDVACYGNGSNPTSSKFSIYNSSACSSQVTATQGGTLPSSSDYRNPTYTISNANAVAGFTNDLAIKIASGTKLIRFRSFTVTFTYTAKVEEPYTVRFYTASGTYTDITEGSAGAGVTPPSMSTPCDGWAFQGWSTSYSNSTTSTTVLNTVTLTTGKYYPAANTTLYPVYTKAGTASTDLTIVPGSYSSKGTSSYGSGAERTASVDGISFGAHYITGNNTNSPASGKSAGTYIQCQASNANIYNKSAFPGSITKVVVNQYAAQAFSLYCGSSQLMASNNTSTGQTPSGTAQSTQTSATQMTWNVSAASNYTFFDIKKGSGTSYISSIVITYLAPTTYYYSYPTCCTALASIKGSITSNTPTSLTLSWSAVTGAEKYQVKVPGSSSHNAWTDVNATSVTVTKSCGTAYTAYFRAIDTDGTHCSTGPESTLAIPAVSYTVTKTEVTNVTSASLSAIPATTCASGFGPITITAATGYALPADITVTNATKSWNSSTGALSISSVTGNVSITITPTCVSPVIGTNPASASYTEGESPSALTVAATLASGTLTYQWQKSTDSGSNWSNESGTGYNTATYAAANISTSLSANGVQYRCIVGNSQGGCTVTSAVATITITEASKCVAPTFSPAADTYNSSQTVTISSSTNGSTIYYTTNGSTPTTSSSHGTAGDASASVTVSSSMTLKAIAVKDGMTDSDVSEAAYVICSTDPSFSTTSNSNITITGARITCAGITKGTCDIDAYGIVYGTSSNPTGNAQQKGTDASTNVSSYYVDLTGLTAATTYYARPYATVNGKTVYGTETSFSTLAAPVITISETSRAFGDRKVNGGPYQMTFTVSGANLTGNIGLAISGTNASLFSIDKNSLTPSTGTVSSTTITVSYSPTSAGSHSATITLSSTGATNKTVSLNGTGKWEVVWSVNGVETPTLVANSTKPTLPSPAPSSCDATSTTFYGWATAEWDGKINSLAGKTVHTSNSTMSAVTANGTTYYAVFAKGTGSPSNEYQLVTDVSQLSVGDKIVIGNSGSTSTYLMSKDTTTESGYQFRKVAQSGSFSISSSKITISTPATSSTDRNNPHVFTVGKSGDYWTFYDPLLTAYVSCVSASNKNSLGYEAELSDAGKWDISISSNQATILSQISNETTTRNRLQANGNPFNTGSSFTCTANSQNDPYIFRNLSDISYSEYMTSCCDDNITIGTPTITGNGTVTFAIGGEALAAGDVVETCTASKTITATVTPAAGYSCTALSFTDGSSALTTDPTIVSTVPFDAPTEQDFEMTFALNTTSMTLTTSATFTAKPLTGWTWGYRKDADAKNNTGDILSLPGDPIEAYIGQYVRFDITGYTPSDVIAAKQNYVYDQEANPKQPVYDTDKLAHVGHSNGYYTTRGKVAGDATITFKSVGNAEITQEMTIRVKALPVVHFVDNVHNESIDDVVATVTTGVVTLTKETPTHADVSDPGSNYNTCERQHIHLVGWIRSDWANEHPGASHSQITSAGNDNAGNPYYYTAGADIDVEAQNGKTFYAVWSKIE